MKKTLLIILVLLFGLLVSNSIACVKTTEVTLFGPNQYLRTAGKPNVYSGTFPGIAGRGKLIIQNGDKNGKNRVNSALIKINGKQIFGLNGFNQKIYKMEAPVNLTKNNSISVELRSNPGSYLNVQVVQAIAAEAAGVIGPGGGVVVVSDPASPIYGAKVEVPQGATTKSEVITLATTTPSTTLPNLSYPAGECINLGPTGMTFNGPVRITLPYKDSDNDE